jgi:hypothetical protein
MSSFWSLIKFDLRVQIIVGVYCIVTSAFILTLLYSVFFMFLFSVVGVCCVVFYRANEAGFYLIYLRIHMFHFFVLFYYYRAKRVLYLTRTHMFFKFSTSHFTFPCFYLALPLHSLFLTYEWILFSINTTVKVDWVEDYLSLGARLKILARNFLLLSN